MLQVDNGAVEIRGKRLDLLAEYAHLTHQLMASKAFTVSEIDECVRVAKKSEEEVREEAKKLAFDFVKGLFEDL